MAKKKKNVETPDSPEILDESMIVPEPDPQAETEPPPVNHPAALEDRMLRYRRNAPCPACLSNGNDLCTQTSP